jgi:hypothetical protein
MVPYIYGKYSHLIVLADRTGTSRHLRRVNPPSFLPHFLFQPEREREPWIFVGDRSHLLTPESHPPHWHYRESGKIRKIRSCPVLKNQKCVKHAVELTWGRCVIVTTWRDNKFVYSTKNFVAIRLEVRRRSCIKNMYKTSMKKEVQNSYILMRQEYRPCLSLH